MCMCDTSSCEEGDGFRNQGKINKQKMLRVT